MLPAGFYLAISATDRTQTHPSDRMATGIGGNKITLKILG